MVTFDRLLGLLAEASSRIRDIEHESRDHEALGEVLALRIEDAGALAQDIDEALRDSGYEGEEVA